MNILIYILCIIVIITSQIIIIKNKKKRKALKEKAFRERIKKHRSEKLWNNI
jgi:hypothetical protein